MKRSKALLFMTLLCYLGMFICGCFTAAEKAPWDCPNPECERKGNTGNYCGGCAYPAPWKKEAFQTVGNIVRFGHYEQDNNTGNGKEAIEWLVLDYDSVNNRVLLLSRYGLDAKPYNTEYDDITWEKCTLRQWLNREFMNHAFSKTEQGAILITAVDNSKSQDYSRWDTNGGNNTQDKIFLLSYAEANKYLGVTHYSLHGNMKSQTDPTAYAVHAGAWGLGGLWWLRSPGEFQHDAAFVQNNGNLGRDRVDHTVQCVRPALWFKLESDIF